MTDSRRSWLFWCVVAVAFSPVVQGLAENLRDDPQQSYSLLALVLIGLLLRHGSESRCEMRARLGAPLLVLGLLLQTLGIAAGSWSIARYGLPVAMLGIALITGRPTVPVVALSFGLIPIPGFIATITSPGLESALGMMASRVLAWTGTELEVGGPLFGYRGLRFELHATDGGIVTAFLLAEIGWYSAVRAGGSWAQALGRAIGCGLLVLVVQPVLVLACVALLAVGMPEIGRFCLTHGTWLTLGAGALVHHLYSGAEALLPEIGRPPMAD